MLSLGRSFRKRLLRAIGRSLVASRELLFLSFRGIFASRSVLFLSLRLRASELSCLFFSTRLHMLLLIFDVFFVIRKIFPLQFAFFGYSTISNKIHVIMMNGLTKFLPVRVPKARNQIGLVPYFQLFRTRTIQLENIEKREIEIRNIYDWLSWCFEMLLFYLSIDVFQINSTYLIFFLIPWISPTFFLVISLSLLFTLRFPSNLYF